MEVLKPKEIEIEAVDPKKIKKDALYKPLLRKFRNFLRKHMETFGLLKTCYYWQTKVMRDKVW